MKYIEKLNEPTEFTIWKTEYQGQSKSWKSFKNKKGRRIKIKIVKENLLKEQGYLCCYCERHIFIDTSHIEHIKPKDKYPDLELNYENLLCSCDPEPGDEKTCGHRKHSWYEESLFVSPLNIDCEDRIKYSSSGELIGIDEAANMTIDKLGLNSRSLINSRQYTIEELENLDKSQIKKLLQLVDGRFHKFYTSIVQNFKMSKTSLTYE